MNQNPKADIETPSGKGAGDENFPVGSFLLPRRLRPHVAKYYAFARAIDDIADNPGLSPEEKHDRLDGFGEAIMGRSGDQAFQKARALRESMQETNVSFRHALDLISAFKQDAVKSRYKNWDELMDYCDRSASPVGRYLLELHGEDKQGFRYSDALCNALQVINHVQDCKDDYLQLDRVYIPEGWIVLSGGKINEIDHTEATEGVQSAIDKCVAGSRELMKLAHRLPSHLKSRSLAMESQTIINIADKLLDKLEHEDPVAGRVELTRPQYIGCGIRGVFSVIFGKG